MSDLFIFAGEASGDLHGEALLRALRQARPELLIAGVGGPRMRAQGMECVMPMEAFQVMGFIDVFLALPRLMRQFYAVRKAILERNPKTVLLIDYPGFNLRMATHLRKKGYKGKICHYICPSVWAWGKKRIQTMAKTLDLLLTIFPFEKKYFENSPLRVEYVGHPLVEKITPETTKENNLLAIFPGSRTKEILRNLPQQLRVVKRLKQELPELKVALSVSQPQHLPLIQKILQQEQVEVHLVPRKDTDELMRSCSVAIAKSGTVTLELALHNVPTVVTYGVSALDLFIVKHLIRLRLPYYCIVNIICNQEVFPELFGPNLQEEALYTKTKEFLTNKKTYTLCQEKCLQLRTLLGNKNSAQEAAALSLDLLRQGQGTV